MAALPQYSKQASKSRHHPATSIGSLAWDCIQANSKGLIRGVTSRGVFIRTNSRWLIFISFEPYSGPLTINAPSARNAGIQLEPGEPVEISSASLSFNEDHVVISTQDLTPWQPRQTVSSALANPGRQKQLSSASEILTCAAKTDGLSAMLPILISSQEPISPEQQPSWYSNILHLAQESNDDELSAASINLLGAGPGLTPSGDDVVIGYLLAMNRWLHILNPVMNLDHINQHVVSASYQKTTTLSANLIECAAQGLADQRLIAALDWLVSDTGGDVQVIRELLTWGSSSGADAFVGFVAALSNEK
jgi:hypothetical protein